MAYNPNGFKTVTHIGSPDPAAPVGGNICLHAYTSWDDVAAVITVGYFNSISKRLKKGDIIMMSLDVDATPILRNYVVTANAAGVVTIAAQNVA